MFLGAIPSQVCECGYKTSRVSEGSSAINLAIIMPALLRGNAGLGGFRTGENMIHQYTSQNPWAISLIISQLKFHGMLIPFSWAA